MFTTIYKYEIKHWLKQPSIYFYAFVLFLISFGALSGMAGEETGRFGGKVLNSFMYLFTFTKRMFILILFLLPAVLGLAVYRDFSSNMHHILYAYPFQKRDYLLAKFLSAFTIFFGLVCMIGLGFILGIQMPWVNPDLALPFNFLTYIQLYGLFILPTIFMIGILVFGIVLLSRNIYTGFC